MTEREQAQTRVVAVLRDTAGRAYAIQLGRMVVYIDAPLYEPTWYAGHMIWLRGQRLRARHIWWRICWAGCSR